MLPEIANINPRELGQLVTRAVEMAQAQSATGGANTYKLLADAAEDLRLTMRMVRQRLRAIQDIWVADQLQAELTAGTFSFQYMTREQVIELMAGQQALYEFFSTPIEVAEGITVTPEVMVNRTKPPLVDWSTTPIQTPTPVIPEPPPPVTPEPPPGE